MSARPDFVVEGTVYFVGFSAEDAGEVVRHLKEWVVLCSVVKWKAEDFAALVVKVKVCAWRSGGAFVGFLGLYDSLALQRTFKLLLGPVRCVVVLDVVGMNFCNHELEVLSLAERNVKSLAGF